MEGTGIHYRTGRKVDGQRDEQKDRRTENELIKYNFQLTKAKGNIGFKMHAWKKKQFQRRHEMWLHVENTIKAFTRKSMKIKQ